MPIVPQSTAIESHERQSRISSSSRTSASESASRQASAITSSAAPFNHHRPLTLVDAAC